MSIISESSDSSLHTDSDYPEEEVSQLKPLPVTRKNINFKIEDLSSPDEYVALMLAQISDEAHLDASHVPSCDVSSVNSASHSFVSGNVSFLEAEKIHEINSKLQRQLHKMLWNYKSTTRPMFGDGKKCGDFLNPGPSNEFESCSSESDEKWKRHLSTSLKEIKKLGQLRESSQSCLETQIQEIKSVEIEREELRSKLMELSKNLNGMVKVRKSMVKKNCQCILF